MLRRGDIRAKRDAGATVAQLTRWLRVERDTAVAATTVGRWLDSLRARRPHCAHASCSSS